MWKKLRDVVVVILEGEDDGGDFDESLVFFGFYFEDEIELDECEVWFENL